jgi:hypothetical protein
MSSRNHGDRAFQQRSTQLRVRWLYPHSGLNGCIGSFHNSDNPTNQSSDYISYVRSFLRTRHTFTYRQSQIASAPQEIAGRAVPRDMGSRQARKNGSVTPSAVEFSHLSQFPGNFLVLPFPLGATDSTPQIPAFAFFPFILAFGADLNRCEREKWEWGSATLNLRRENPRWELLPESDVPAAPGNNYLNYRSNPAQKKQPPIYKNTLSGKGWF